MEVVNFLKNIDRNFSCERSIILRYRNCVFPVIAGKKKISLDDNTFQDVSILEGSKIYPFIYYKDVKISILDETSLMASGTFKSLDACISLAIAKSQGIKTLVFESGGNTGTAFSIYAAMLKLRTFLVMPLDNLYLLSEKSFLKPYNYIIAVKNAKDTKIVSEKISKLTLGYRIPRLEWMYIAATFRGYRILEYLLEKGGIDWLSQTISAGFGPIGIYRVLNSCKKTLLYNIPRFLGVQQAENCPYYKKIKGVKPEEITSTKDLLIPIMYDFSPFSYQAFDAFKEIIDYHGRILTINKDEFNIFTQKYLNPRGIVWWLLEENGTFIYKENSNIIDKAGLVGLAGVFKAVDSGVIKKGQAVLHALSSGSYRISGSVKPDFVIEDMSSIDTQLNSFIESIQENKVYADA